MDAGGEGRALPAGWRRVWGSGATGAAELLQDDRTGGAFLAVPAVHAPSMTFQLSGVPRPTDRLSTLVERVVLAAEVTVVPSEAQLAGGTGHPQLVRCTVVELVRGDRVLLSSGPVANPFARAAVQGTCERADAVDLLAAATGGVSDTDVVVRVELPPEQAGKPTRVRVALGRLWTALDAAADDSRVFGDLDLRNYLPGWMRSGVVAVESGDGGVEEVLAGVLKAARHVLSPVGDPAGYRLADDSPGEQEVTASVPPGPAPAGGALEVRAPLARVLAGALDGGADRVVHMVTADGGRLTGLLPSRRVAPARGPGGRLTDLHWAQDDRILALGTTFRPNVLDRITGQHVRYPLDVELVRPEVAGQEAGPVGADTAAPMWRDRFDAGRMWYAPTFTVVVPDPTGAADPSPFRFDLATAGHAADGSPGLVATIILRLRAARSAATEGAWLAAGSPPLSCVPLESLTVQMAVPFRDENGVTKVQTLTAEEVHAVGDLGADGTVHATFRLVDGWARLAYGALSTPGFQDRQAEVTVSAAFPGWRVISWAPSVVGLHTSWTILPRPTAGGRASRPEWQALRPAAVAHAAVLPAWRPRWQLPGGEMWYRSYFGTSATMPVFMPCATYGALYREQRDGQWHAIGCRPALQLGQLIHRTHEEVAVAAAEGHARVYRSLTSPARFVVVPRRYAVGRFPRSDAARAYRPMLLLHSTIDADDPTRIRCVLAASLQPDLPAYRRSAILAELRRTAHPEPVLEHLAAAGVEPRIDWAVPSDVEIDCIPVGDGFDTVLSTDVAGFLSLRSLLERDAVGGTVSAELPGGVRLESRLVLGVGAVVGPADAGPVELLVDGRRLDARNRTGQRIALTAVALDGAPVAQVGVVLDAGATVAVDLPDGVVPVAGMEPVYTVESGAEQLEEVRAYVEDLRLGVLFVSTADPAAHGLAGLEVRTRFLGHDDADVLFLTTATREAERVYVCPLTGFAADPAVEFTVTAVGLDGTRREDAPVSWPVRTRGALVPVDVPSQT